MTKKELEIAQYLHHTATRAEKLANDVDPKMKRESLLAVSLDSLRKRSRHAFSQLVGRTVEDVDSSELNTNSPAAWTRQAKDVIWGRR